MRCKTKKYFSFILCVSINLASFSQGFEGYYNYPTAHNNTLVFSAEGDLWTVPITGGLAQRLTTHAEEELFPKISPDGKMVIYQRMSFDIMSDKKVGNLWLISTDGKTNKKLTSREGNESQATWSPNGDRIAFASRTSQGSEIFVYWNDGGQIAKITQLEKSPSNITWSPDGKHLAFTLRSLFPRLLQRSEFK